MNQGYDVCIIGAGAAGLAAANVLDPALRICIIDRNEIPGRKIMVTGGGRCNLTNRACRRHDMTLDFFRGLGLETRCDQEGRFYPYSMVAGDVVESLTRGLKNRDIKWRLSERVSDVRRMDPGSDGIEPGKYAIAVDRIDSSEKDDPEDEVHAYKVIICTGGKAAPKFGTTGDGYGLARNLGHSVTRIYPILTGISTEIPENVAGIRARGKVSLLEDGELVITEKGEIQFTADGLSGICVFDLTPHIRIRDGEDPKEGVKRFAIRMDLAPDMSEEEIKNRRDSFGIVTGALAEWIAPENLKNTVLPVEGVWGWDRAQCTAGGIPAGEMDPDTMESLICPGLYFAGEIVDAQGSCGGFNLQNAWETGISAAKAINESFAKATGGVLEKTSCER